PTALRSSPFRRCTTSSPGPKTAKTQPPAPPSAGRDDFRLNSPLTYEKVMLVAVTLRDVALHAGVAPRTVSNVVNNYPYVSAKMRIKVQASLDELNYKPNLMARSLRQGRTGNITLLLPFIAVPYFGEIAHEVVEYA